MTIRKRFCLLLSMLMLTGVMSLFSVTAAHAEDTGDYIRDGLFAWYKGDQNTRDGQNANASSWQDLVGGHDLPVNRNQNNFFTDKGFRVNGQKHYFPDEILNLVNGSSFTIEIEFGDFDATGGDYNVFMNSSNDYFSLFRRVSQNVIEWKYGGGNNRPKISQGLRYLGGHLLTFTCEYGGPMVMYVDGVEMARTVCDLYMGANDLFIGQTEPSRSYNALYKNIRFYSRPLTADEVGQNAASMGYDGEALLKSKTHISVAQPVTRIVGDVAVVRPINSREEFASMIAKKNLPATAIYKINQKLETVDANGAAFSTVALVMKESDYKILPCFVVKDRATADALAKYLDQIYFYDVQIMSADKEVLKYARDLLPRCYGILDLREDYAQADELSTEQLLDIRRAVKTYNASVAVLPVSLCRNQDLQYLFERQVNVWAWETDTPDAVEPYYALLSGAVGVVTDDTDTYLDIACNRLAPNTLTRVPTNIGHRGMPTGAPENTLEGSILAFENGANVIEMDVYLTKDGHVVAIHDSTTGRTCNENLVVESSTLAQLKRLYANKYYEEDPVYGQCRIPTLEEYLEWFKGKDCLFFIEIKSENIAIVPAIKKLIEQYDMYGQCSVITFDESIMAAMRKDYPEMSVGALSGAIMNGTDPEEDMTRVMDFIGQYNGTHNPSCDDYGGEDLRACMIRGINIYPYDIAGTNAMLSDYFLWGYGGLTNDHAYMMSNVVCHVSPIEFTSLRVNGYTEICHTLKSFDGSTSEQHASGVFLLEGEARTGRYSITPLKAGKLSFMTAVSLDMLSQDSYVIYTQPVTITVTDPNEKPDHDGESTAEHESDTESQISTPADSAETDLEADVEATDDSRPSDGVDTDSLTAPQASEKGCGSAVGGAVCIVAVIAAAIVCVAGGSRRKTNT